MRQSVRVVFAAGGTGGHVFPAIYIAEYLKKHWGANCLFIGTHHGIENIKVPQAGFPVKYIWIRGFRRGFYLSNLLFPFRLLISMLQARRELRRFQPDLVIGTGGYVSGPVLYQAVRAKIPTAIQEQNSYPGITTRLLANKVDLIFIAYPEAQQYLKTLKPCVVAGNPVRESISAADENEARAFFDLKSGKTTVLAFGGSQGSYNINKAIDSLLQRGELDGLQVIWQTGASHFERYAEKYKNFAQENLRIIPFIDRMDLVYRISDFAICRAGAMTLSELAAAGLPAILIPFSHAAADHQLKNAQTFAEGGGAIIVEDKAGMEDHLAGAIRMMLESGEYARMSENMRDFHHPDTLSKIAYGLQQLIRNGELQAVNI
jgi:UDP-N-acetylglucosamine--N-acetylmuramyl-(pentapeptide) pyrophosphoryl-undecaprenol N-acetylglucosamine transferase